MKTVILQLAVVVVFILAVGCGEETTTIDMRNDDGAAVMGLDYRDFDQAASQMIQSLVASGSLKKPGGGRYVVAKGRIVNDTMQRIDTDQLMAKVESEMMNTGMAVMTSAVGSGTDKLVTESRELRDSEEFDPNTVAQRGTLIAPDLSISGKIFQRNIRVSKNKQQVEYYFQLMLSDVKSGLRFWQDEVVVGKRGSSKSVAW